MGHFRRFKESPHTSREFLVATPNQTALITIRHPCMLMLEDWDTDSEYGPRDKSEQTSRGDRPVGVPNFVRTAEGLSRHTGQYCRRRNPRPPKQGRLEIWRLPASTFSTADSATASSTHSPHGARNASLLCVVWRIHIFVSFDCRRFFTYACKCVSQGTSPGRNCSWRSCLGSRNMLCS